MTNVQSPPPPGWYADPSVPGGQRYWDGSAWTPHTSPAPSVPQLQGRPLGPRFGRLAVTLSALLALMAVNELVDLLVSGWGVASIRRFQDDPLNGNLHSLDVYDTLSRLTGVTWLVGLLVTGVVWCVWQYRVARSVATQLRRTPGMHAGSWFIPVAALWLPVQNVSNLWQVLARTSMASGIVGFWWAGWLLTSLLGRIEASLSRDAESLGDYLGVAGVGVAEGAIGLVTALLALLIVRRITAMAVATDSAP